MNTMNFVPNAFLALSLLVVEIRAPQRFDISCCTTCSDEDQWSEDTVKCVKERCVQFISEVMTEAGANADDPNGPKIKLNSYVYTMGPGTYKPFLEAAAEQIERSVKMLSKNLTPESQTKLSHIINTVSYGLKQQCGFSQEPPACVLEALTKLYKKLSFNAEKKEFLEFYAAAQERLA